MDSAHFRPEVKFNGVFFGKTVASGFVRNNQVSFCMVHKMLEAALTGTEPVEKDFGK